MKGASPLVSMVFVIAFSMLSLTLVISVLNPVINRARDSSVIDEGINNLEFFYSVIKEVASEARGAKRTISIRVTDGTYEINSTKELIYFEYETKGGLRASGISGDLFLEPSPVFFDYFNDYQENSDASETWTTRNGTWKVTGARYYGSCSALSYRNLGKLKDFEIASKIINSNDNIPGEVFVVPKDPESLVLYLPFDEGNGNVAWDYSGYNNTGILKDANITNSDGDTPPQWVDGKFGNALNFDRVDDYVNVSDSASLDITDEITVEAWFKPEGIYQSMIVDKNNAYRIWISWGDGSWATLAFSVYINEAWNDTEFSVELLKGQWYHLLGVYNGSTSKLYLNGNLVASKSLSGNINESDEELLIGRYKYSGEYYFNGTIDEVHIYNRALSEEEIKAEYVLGLKKLFQSGVEQISLPNWLNVSLVLASPYKTYFDDIVVRTNENKMKLILPLRNVDLTGSLHISKGSHQVVIENKGVNTQTNKPIIEISAA